MTKILLIVLGLSQASVSIAQPSVSFLNFLQKRYDPKVEHFATDSENSMFNCQVQRVIVMGKDPLTGRPRAVQLKQYWPRETVFTDSKAIIIMPPTGGENILDKKYGNEFCRAGFRAVTIQSWSPMPALYHDIPSFDQEAVRTLAAIRHTLDYLNQTQTHSVGILGTSLGAIQASLALGYESRLKAAVLIVGGVNLAHIIANSNEPGISQTRLSHMHRYKLSPEAYAQKLKSSIRMEPSQFINMTGPKKVFSVIATRDFTVPSVDQEALYQAFGSQEVVRYNTDHFGGVKKAALNLPSTFVRFFSENL